MTKQQYNTWLAEGLFKGYLRLGCMQHDPPFSEEELSEHYERFDEGDDPCLHVARIIPFEETERESASVVSLGTADVQ